MNKYLISLLLIFVEVNAFAEVLFVPASSGSGSVLDVYDNDYIDFDKIRSVSADEYQIKTSSIYIQKFSDWQNWVANVNMGTEVSLYVSDIDFSNNGEKLKHVLASDVLDVTLKDTANLYNISFDSPTYSEDVFLKLVRETDYTKIFRDSRGTFLENIRLNHPDDKTLSAMDNAGNMYAINFIMNSSYHFNPLVLMNPIKTINRAVLTDFLSGVNSAVDADVDYILSDKINDYGGHLYIADKYEDLFFKIGVNLNHFSYGDNFNEFDGFAYGLDVRARQYLNEFWLDGLVGVNRASFNADYIYTDSDSVNNPKGMSEYMRLSVGYDYKKISDFVISPFVGFMFQNIKVLGVSDNEMNLHTGLSGKYSIIMDGIKYEYGATVATDENADFNVGANIGFLSVLDGAGAHVGISAFKNEFGVNYKLSINAKVQF